MIRSVPLPLAVLAALSFSRAQEVQVTELSRIKPLSYVVNLEPLEGQALIMKNVTCQASGRPDTQGRLYLTHLPGNLVRVARVEYNEQGRYVLEHGKSVAPANKYYDRYVTQQQPFGTFTLNALEGLWRLFGLRFTLENLTYRCKLT